MRKQRNPSLRSFQNPSSSCPSCPPLQKKLPYHLEWDESFEKDWQLLEAVKAGRVPLDDSLFFYLLRKTALALRDQPFIEKITAWQHEVRHPKDPNTRRQALRNLRQIARALDPSPTRGRWSKFTGDFPVLYRTFKQEIARIKKDGLLLRRQHPTWTSGRILRALREQYRTPMLDEMQLRPLRRWTANTLQVVMETTPREFVLSTFEQLYRSGEDAILKAAYSQKKR